MASDRSPVTLAAYAAAAAPTWRAAYSDRTCSLMSALSELAYVPFEVAEATGVGSETSTAGFAELQARLGEGGFKLVEVFDFQDTQAYLAVNPEQMAVLAFRGTTSLTDWKVNLNAARIPLPNSPKAVTVHKGFYEAFGCCRERIEAAVNANVPADLGLYITGHSLGGALAQIASAILERDNLAACYTFGSPRVGTAEFDRKVKCPHYRLINDWDTVPGVPPPWFHGYHHTGDPRLLTPGADEQEALRRDRSPVGRFVIDVWDLLVFAFTRRLPIIDDHMIWRYRGQLYAIASARNPKSPALRLGKDGSPPPA